MFCFPKCSWQGAAVLERAKNLWHDKPIIVQTATFFKEGEWILFASFERGDSNKL